LSGGHGPPDKTRSGSRNLPDAPLDGASGKS
jgi:hypothetical protein